MHAARVTTLLAALALVVGVIPAATASHTFLLPSETGLGEGNVAYEPDSAKDDNGIPSHGFSPQSDTLILEGYHGGGTPYPLWVDHNTPLNVALHGDSYDEYERYILPGNNLFVAFWGWWHDKGSGGYLEEAGVPGTGDPDGVINDGHDDWGNSADNTEGEWDEFIWRGVNPWASQHGYESHPEDVMYAFIQPGTHGTLQTADPGFTPGLQNSADDGDTPDFQMSDNTDQGPCTGATLPVCAHNKHGGWGNAFGFAGLYYDASLLISTEVTMAVNPQSTGSGTFDPFTPSGDAADHAVDTDRYSALAPQVETLYRTAVYDPGDEEGGDLLDPEGPKQFAKDYYSSGQYLDDTNDAINTVEPAFEPTQDARGAADDAASKAWPHEPNTADDDFNGHASFDATTSYGGEPYYDPGPGQTYDGYAVAEEAWLDMKPFVSTFTDYTIQVRSFTGLNTFAGTAEDRTMVPGELWLAGNFGLWADRNADTWIGNTARDHHPEGVDNPTVTQSENDPYAGGLIDDPNDYDHTNQDSPESEEPEWRGLCDGSVTATVVPDNSDQSWGTTGVYVFRDAESPNTGYNPWDDAVEDATGDVSVAGNQVLDDQDDETLSQYRTSGPIDISFGCQTTDESGGWLGAEHILLPTGSLEVPVKITTTAVVGSGVLGSYGGTDGVDLGGDTVVDVDYLEAGT